MHIHMDVHNEPQEMLHTYVGVAASWGQQTQGVQPDSMLLLFEF